jgi:hypothetical protein
MKSVASFSTSSSFQKKKLFHNINLFQRLY